MIKTFLALPFLLVALAASAATLVWDPSDPTQGPPAVSYKVYSSPVVHPTNATWTLFGTSATTNLAIAGNVYKMFQITALNAQGVESIPSGSVTNDFAPPAPPGRSRVTASIESAPGLNGPWLELTNVSLIVSMVTPPESQFFRTRTDIVTLESP